MFSRFRKTKSLHALDICIIPSNAFYVTTFYNCEKKSENR